MSTFYKIYCETDSKWEYEWGNTPITVCPIDGGHAVNSNSVSDLEEIFYHDFTLNTKIAKEDIDVTTYKEIFSFLYKGSDKVGSLRKIEITFSMDPHGVYETDSTDFGFFLNIRDTTNNTSIFTSAQFPGKEIITTLFENFTSTSSIDSASWRIQIKKAVNCGDINIRGIKLYYFYV